MEGGGELRRVFFLIFQLALVVCSVQGASRLKQQAYIWQRDWNIPMREAIDERMEAFAQIVVLAAEITWRGTNRIFEPVAIDYRMLAKKPQVGLAIRINSYKGALDGPAIADLANLSAGVVDEAHRRNLALAELQLDYDCPDSKLDSYRVLIAEVKKRVKPLPVTITSLPSWLDARGFKELILTADGYVLQVHSLQSPTRIDTPYILCDTAAAKKAAARAARFHRSFRIALPTYSYLLAFNSEGNFIGLSAEGPSRQWPEGSRLKTVSADAKAIAPLVAGWLHSPPPHCEAIIWYRTPVPGDRFNWGWPTLEAVMAGRTPGGKVEAVVRHPQPLLAEIDFVNKGEDAAVMPSQFVLSAHGGRLLAGDALQGYEAREASGSKWIFKRTQADRIAPGQKRMVGWVRLEKKAEVQIEISKD
jgi:hypothetical protein